MVTLNEYEASSEREAELFWALHSDKHLTRLMT